MGIAAKMLDFALFTLLTALLPETLALALRIAIAVFAGRLLANIIKRFGPKSGSREWKSEPLKLMIYFGVVYLLGGLLGWSFLLSYIIASSAFGVCFMLVLNRRAAAQRTGYDQN